MKIFTMHIIFLISATFLYGCSYASPAFDSLPSCILKMKQKDSLLVIDKYDYKGQQWFGISRILTEQEMKKVSYIKTIIFYNSGCTQVASWRTGGNGIRREDNILPDSIDKTKIIKVAEKVPEKIMQLAIIINAASITEYDYQGQTLYYLNMINDWGPQKKIITESYYDKNGKEIIYHKRVTDPAFSRADRWEPYATVHPEKLIKKGIIWHNPSARQTK